MTTTPLLGITDWAAAQASPWLVHNDAIRLLEQGSMWFSVKDKDLATPPGSPADGDGYIVAASATGAWAGQDGNLAFYVATSGWKFLTAVNGMNAYVQDEGQQYRRVAGAWSTTPDSGIPTGGATGYALVKQSAADYDVDWAVPGYPALDDLTNVSAAAPVAGDAILWDGTNWTATKLCRGALVKKSADQTAANYTTATAVAWDAEEYDDAAIHDNVTNNTRLTVPTGVTRVRLLGEIALSAVTSDLWVSIHTQKNGATYIGRSYVRSEIGTTTPGIAFSGPILNVTAGDYFELVLQNETDTSITITAASSWFAMEILS